MAQIFENIDNVEVLFSTIGTDRVEVSGNFNSIQLDINFVSGNGQPDVTTAVIERYNTCRVNINNGQYIGGLGSYLLYCYLFYTEKEQYIDSVNLNNLSYGTKPLVFRMTVNTPQIQSISLLNDTPVMLTFGRGSAMYHPKLKTHYLSVGENFGFSVKKQNVMICRSRSFEDMLPTFFDVGFSNLVVDGNFSYKERTNRIYRKFVSSRTEKRPVSEVYDCIGFDSAHTMTNKMLDKLTIIYQD